MEGETEAVLWIAVLMQERDTDAGYERPGMPIPRERGC